MTNCVWQSHFPGRQGDKVLSASDIHPGPLTLGKRVSKSHCWILQNLPSMPSYSLISNSRCIQKDICKTYVSFEAEQEEFQGAGPPTKTREGSIRDPTMLISAVCPALGKQFPEVALLILPEISSVCFGLEWNVLTAKDARVLSTTMRNLNPQPPEVLVAHLFS